MERFHLIRRPVPELAERKLSEEGEQLDVLGGLLDVIGEQGRSMLGRRERRRLHGTTFRLMAPNLAGRPAAGVIPKSFTVEKGIVINWEGLPTAAAIGYLEGDTNPSLVGGVHMSEYLQYNRLDPRDPAHFPLLVRTLPACHVDDEQNLAFAMGKLTTSDDLGVLIGDHRATPFIHDTVPFEQFRNPQTRSEALSTVKGYLALAFHEKYGRA